MYKILYIESGDYLYSLAGTIPYSIYELSQQIIQPGLAKHIICSSKDRANEYLNTNSTIVASDGSIMFISKNKQLFEVVRV